MKDLIVIETASVLAGPAVGMFFAELGAQVVKVENKRTGGDVTRRWKLPSEDQGSPASAYFSSVNWGKKHVFLDLADPDDREHFDDLLRKADVLITNHLAKSAQRLGLELERIKVLNPRLIHGHISGYSRDPARPAYDVVLQAETGYISMTGSPEHPAKMPIAMIDMLAAHQLKQGLLLALLERQRTGNGSYVEVSLEDAALSGLINQASNYLMADVVAGPIGTRHPNIAPYGDLFRCKDERTIVLAVGSDGQFRSLCEVLSVQLHVDPRYNTNQQRVLNRDGLCKILYAQISQINSTDLLDALRERVVPAGLVKDLASVLSGAMVQDLILKENVREQQTQRIKGNVFRIEHH